MADQLSQGTRGKRSLSMPVSMADIARLANVSKPTVSRVINGNPLVSEATRNHVLAVASEHGYAVNRNAQKLRQARTDTVQVVVDFAAQRTRHGTDSFLFELLEGVADALSARHVDLLLSAPIRGDARSYQDRIAARAVDGFLFLGHGEPDPMLRDLAGQGVPLVAWGAVDAAQPYCAVGNDTMSTGTLAGCHFLRRGRKRWMFIGNEADIRMRQRGFSEAARKGGATVTMLAIQDASYAETHRALSQHLAHHAAPDAIFTSSDTAARAAIAAMSEVADHAVPRDYALVSDNSGDADFTPAITTIEQDTRRAGAMLVEKLMQVIEGEPATSTMLPTRLVPRET